MELLKFFIKDEVPAVGLSPFREQKKHYYQELPKLNFRKQIFKPNYNNNFFLL